MNPGEYLHGDNFVFSFPSRKLAALPVIGFFGELGHQLGKGKVLPEPKLTKTAQGLDFYIEDPTVINLEISVDAAPCNSSALLAQQLGIAAAELPSFRYIVPLQVEFATYQLFWSAGVGFLGLRDQRFQTDPIPGNTTDLKLIRLKDSGISYRLLVLAHYCDVGSRALCMSFGLGTDIPSNGLTAALGLTGRLRVLPITDSMYLTVGGAYGPHKVLNSDFEGRSTVPVGTTTASLFENRYDIKWFAAVSFGFFGSKEDFSGLYKGKPQPAAGQ